jgi:hypothetical protein
VTQGEMTATATEKQVLNLLWSDINDVNNVLLDGQIFRLDIKVDDSPNARDRVDIDSTTKRFLQKYGDPIAVSFIEPVRKKIDIANRKFLRSFKLRLVIEEVVS